MRRLSLVAALVACGCASATRDEGAQSPLVDFHVVGCSRDFPGHDSLRTRIERQEGDGTIGFVVHHPDACGLQARDPRFSLEDGVLRLRYTLEQQSGMHLLCECEYRATFTFDRSMEGVDQVRFDDGPVVRVR